jgi:hypothetical protein
MAMTLRGFLVGCAEFLALMGVFAAIFGWMVMGYAVGLS